MQAELSEQLWIIAALCGYLFCWFFPMIFQEIRRLSHFLAWYWEKPLNCADPRGAVSPCAQQRHSCCHHSLMKIDDGWFVFCPVSLRGKTLEMATSTIPWQSSAYSFLREERERESDAQAGQTSWPPTYFYIDMHFPRRIYKILLPLQVAPEWQTGGRWLLFHLLSTYPSNHLLFKWYSHSQYCSLQDRTTKPII